ncbi:MAG: hypothetical protein R3E87_03460 [Burkholderiaceae bacterium]
MGRAAAATSLISLVFLIGGCGGGGGTTGSTALGSSTATKTINVSGRLTYTDYDVGAGGIDYANPVERPIRGAVVELQIPPGTKFGAINSSDNGEYSFSGVPANAQIRVLVKAALGFTSIPDTTVVDNTNGGALYSIADDTNTGDADMTINLNAGSGWDNAATAYTGTRAAAPFAILDVIYQAQQLIKSADPAVNFPILPVNWSPDNRPSTAINPAVGDIGTSHYSPQDKALFILGATNLDTDEYDSSIIGHEWSHYFEANFSRSDNPGGGHNVGDLVHPSLAFGEGYGYAMGAIITGVPFDVDTGGPNQAAGTVRSIENDSTPPTATVPGLPTLRLDGYYSETSVQEILYDLFDGGPGDDDAIALGFGPIYQTLIGGQKGTPAFTSIFSFMHHLKKLVPGQAAAIDALALGENIDLSADSEFEAPSDPIYTDITLATSPLTSQVFDTFGPITATDPGNKILNQRFFRFVAPAAGCFSLTVTPTNPTTADVVIFAPDGGGVDVNGPGVAESFSGQLALNETSTFAVGAFAANAEFSVAIAPAPAAACP